MINTDGVLAAVRVCKQPATSQGIFLGLIFLSFVFSFLSRGADMQPSAWPAGWMPAQVPSPRWKSHLQPASQSPKVKKTEIFPSQIAALPGATAVAHTCSVHGAAARVGAGTRRGHGASPTGTPEVRGCGVLPMAEGRSRVLWEACTPRQEPHGVQEHTQIKGRI